jgi:hypothetical protein
MAITPGARLGPYEIVAPIGAGGMGEVFRARDTRLDRSVAIKVLATNFAPNEQLRMRFEREAKTISQLNHPNICTLHDVGHHEGIDYLVLELIEGESLADRLARGPMPLQETLKAGAQIADALDRAHRAGIVHRDLKPGNVMLTRSGVKLLDFGLAKPQSSADPRRASVVATERQPLTEEGTLIGTFQYMAPEQLEGVEADARTDIFALGAVLYEMATGRRAFSGKTKTSLIAAIVSSEPPPISSLQPTSPPAFDHLVRKCMAKERDDRWQSAHDVASELRWIADAGSQAGLSAPLAMKRKSRERLAWLAAVVALAALASALALRRPPAPPPLTASITPPLHGPFDFMDDAALSPDGETLAFIAHADAAQSLWIRRMDRGELQPLPATDGAVQPFWSPDNASIGFFADGKLKRIAVAGGPPQVLCDAPVPGGGTWGARGVILMGSAGLGPLYRVDASGGPRQAATKLAPREEAHRWPSFCPDGEHFVFLGDASKTEDHHIKIGSLSDGSARDLMPGITNAQVGAPDKLLFVRARTLLARTFDPRSGTLTGEPRVIAEQVVPNDLNHRFEFSTSSNGRLVYRSARADAQLEWVDRAGNRIASVGEPHRYDFWRLAPDQQRLAVSLLDADGRPDDIWVVDPARSMTTRITFDPAGDTGPAWSPDGARMAFSSMRTGFGDLYVIDVANPTAVRTVAHLGQIIPYSWTRDGTAVIAESYKETDADIVICSVNTKEAKPFVASQFQEVTPALSPDDAWIAYASDESGRLEVYIERFPTHAARRQVSTTGGESPWWRGDGKELYFIGPNKSLMAVDPADDRATPKQLFRLPGVGFEPSRDGQRFVIDRPIDDRAKVPLTFVSGWGR